MIAVGYRTSTRFNTVRSKSRFEGIGRQGLFAASSLMARGCIWLSMANGNKLIQVQNIVRGIALITLWSVGFGFVVRTGPASVLSIPNIVLGPTMVFRSLKVNSQIVLRQLEAAFILL